MAVDDAILRTGTTIRDYVKGYQDAISNKYIVFDRLKARGKIVYRCAGSLHQYQVQYNRGDVNVNDGAQTVTAVARDRFKEATLRYEGFETSDAISKRERLLNSGKAALIEYASRMKTLLADDLDDHISRAVYNDGPATDGTMDGFDSFTGFTQTINADTSTTTARTSNAADYVANPTDTYNALDCTLAAYGSGLNAGPWPKGVHRPRAEFWTPLIVNHTCTKFGGATFAANCVSALRYGLTMSRKRKPVGGKGEVDWVLTDADGFYAFKEKYDSKERWTVSEALGNPHFGFREAINFEGAMVSYEYGVPVAASPGVTGESVQMYGFNFNSMEFRSCQKTLFDVEDMEWLPLERRWVCIADCIGNFKFISPRDFIKWLSIK